MTITPSAYRHCGVERREHAQRWTAPTQQQIKDRMRARRQEATADG